MGEFYWYVLNVASGKELETKEWIDNNKVKDKSVSEKIKNVYVKKDGYYQVKNNKNVFAEKVRVPCYIFIEADLEGGFVEEFIQKAPYRKLYFMYNSDGSPKRLSKIEADKMLQKENDYSKEVGEETFFLGEVVDIIDGTFTNFSGKITCLNKSTVKLHVEILTKTVEVELYLTQIKKKNNICQEKKSSRL